MNIEQSKFMLRTNPTQEDFDAAYALGMIRKEDLIIGVSYDGDCRNASEAVWQGDHFVYMRSKYGMVFEDTIKYPTDEPYHDVFIPWSVSNEN